MLHSTSTHPNQKPQCAPPEIENVPATMRAEPRWVLWRFDWRGSNWTKTPINAQTGHAASSTNAKTWVSFTEAVAAYRRGGVDGIGFVLGDGWAGVDLDDHLDGDGRLTPFAKHILSRLNSYHEVSPSGEGIKVFIRGAIEHGHADHKAGIEVYASGRYFTLTGRKLADSPDEVADRPAELLAVLSELKPSRLSVNSPSWRAMSDTDKALAALAEISGSRADGYRDWIAVGMALHAVDAALLDAWDRWSAQSAKHDEQCCSRAWYSFGNRCGYGIASLIHWANEDSPGWRDSFRARRHTASRSMPSMTNHVTQLVVRRLSDVEPQQLEWLWLNRIPLGKLTLLAGDPGLGKSFVTCDLAARVSRGSVWPDDSTRHQPVGSVIMFNCEDGLADTIRPRLDQAGADVSKIVCIEGTTVIDPDTGEARQRGFSLAVELPRLAQVLDELTDCRLIVIDPVSAYCGETDSHKNADVRALLAPLADLAEKHHAAIVMITHLSKGSGSKAVYRAMGSLAFAAAARAVWHFAKDPDDELRRLMLPAKMNLAPDPTGLAYCIEDGAVRWEADPVRMTADELLALEAEKRLSTQGTQHAQAADWLRMELQNGDVASKHVLTDGRENGFSEKQLRAALKFLGGKTNKQGMNGPWVWTLPGASIAETVNWNEAFPP